MTEIKKKHIPMRMCIACRKMHKQAEMIRIVKENGTAVLDMEKTHFGRGAYICIDEECIKKAHKKHIVDKHLKCALHDDIYEECEKIGKSKKG